MKPRSGFRLVQRGSLLIGAFLLGLWSAASLESFGFQAIESRKLDAAVRGQPSGTVATPSLRAAIIGPLAADSKYRAKQPKKPLGRIEIPRLGIQAMVAEGVDNGTLKRAVGHVPYTALPGSPGNCALAGHRDTHFRGLGEVRTNDVIRIVTPERTYLYQVDWTVVVGPRRVDLLDSTDARALTIVTCYPFKYVGRAPKRFVVRATQVKAVAEHRIPPANPEPASGNGRTSLKQGR